MSGAAQMYTVETWDSDLQDFIQFEQHGIAPGPYTLMQLRPVFRALRRWGHPDGRQDPFVIVLRQEDET